MVDFLKLEIRVVDKRIKYGDIDRVEIKKGSKHTFRWTDKKTYLVELLRGVISMSSINSGDIVINDFIIYIGEILDVDLSNHNSLYNDILSRAGRIDDPDDRTIYLRRMIDKFNLQLSQLDERQ